MKDSPLVAVAVAGRPIRAERWAANVPWLAVAAVAGIVWYLTIVAPVDGVRAHSMRLAAIGGLLDSAVSAGDADADARRFVVALRRALPALEYAEIIDSALLRAHVRRLEDSLRLGTYSPVLHHDAVDELVRVRAALRHAVDAARDRSEHLHRRIGLALGMLGALAVAAGAVVTGFMQAEELGRMLGFDASGEQDESFFRSMRAELARVGRWTGELWQRRKNGEADAERVVRVRIDDPLRRALGYLTVSMDLTPANGAARLFTWQAHHDALTKLPNRTLLIERIAREIVRPRQANRAIALLSVDIDGFKRVNDSIGPMLGDRLLTEASVRIVIAVSQNDTVARIGSDKFAVMIAETDPAEADRVALSIQNAFSMPFVLDGRELVVTASIGVALSPADGDDSLRLLQRADAAMAQAKSSGGNAVVFFETEMNTRAERRHTIETDLRRALKTDQLVLHYQPVIDRRTSRLVGAEALLRWQHPEWGLVSPGEFIPIAEESGLIVDIGRWVIDAVQHQLTDWRDGQLGDLRVAVNLSARELRRAEDLDALKRAIGRMPCSLCIEITESVLLSDTDRLLGFLSGLRDMGVRIALDDFGTGYSSLSYLRRFPFDVLKIDRSFVKELETSDADFALVSSITSLGRILGLDVVAEGVETADQLARVVAAGCDLVQGYYVARPHPPNAFAAYVAQLHGNGAGSLSS